MTEAFPNVIVLKTEIQGVCYFYIQSLHLVLSFHQLLQPLSGYIFVSAVSWRGAANVTILRSVPSSDGGTGHDSAIWGGRALVVTTPAPGCVLRFAEMVE